MLKDFVSPNVLNILACQIAAVRNTTAGIHLPMWLSEYHASGMYRALVMSPEAYTIVTFCTFLNEQY